MDTRKRPRRERPPLDPQRLEELAVRYVGRFATTQARLRTYLARKIRERGWGDEREPDLEAVVSRFAELGYVDDAAYALAKSRALTNRGYGTRRLDETLRAAGVADEEAVDAREYAAGEAVGAALRFAERKRIGPFAAAESDPKEREKALASMLRAGHSFPLARAIVGLRPGARVDAEELREQNR